eukprot:jgi/Picsp_1/1898/NSC_05364-R1_protein
MYKHLTLSGLNVPGSLISRPQVNRNSRQTFVLSQRVYASGEDDLSNVSGVEELESDAERARKEAERLRAAEKFMVVGTGEAECKSCGYTYSPAQGDSEYPIAKGTAFNNLPDDWNCPVCGSEKSMFISKQKEIAGFAENQGYGLGTNSMTGEQKSLLIFGSLAAFFVLFLLGYTIN